MQANLYTNNQLVSKEIPLTRIGICGRYYAHTFDS